MIRRRYNTHGGQLLAASCTLTGVTGVLVRAAAESDGPTAATWGPVLGGAIVAWVLSAVWLTAAATVTVRAVWHNARVARRPRPGTGGRPIPPLMPTVRLELAEERPYRVGADAWQAGRPMPVQLARPRHAAALSATVEMPAVVEQLVYGTAA